MIRKDYFGSDSDYPYTPDLQPTSLKKFQIHNTCLLPLYFLSPCPLFRLFIFIERLDQGHLYPLGERRDKHVTVGARTSDLLRCRRLLYLKSYLDSLLLRRVNYVKLWIIAVELVVNPLKLFRSKFVLQFQNGLTYKRALLNLLTNSF